VSRPPKRWTPPNRRTRTRSQGWWAERNHALTVDCVGHPRGCQAKAGQVCVAMDGQELVNQTAHAPRVQRAEAENPTHLPLTIEETP
jgi:hypothetical protein